MAISKYYFDSFLTQLDNFIKERVSEEVDRLLVENAPDSQAPTTQGNPFTPQGKEWGKHVFDAAPMPNESCDSCGA